MKKSIVFFILCLMLSFFSFAGQSKIVCDAAAETKADLKISAKSALLVDAATNTVVYEKNAHERLPIASMTKLATLALVFKCVDNGNLKVDELVTVSQRASKIGGSSAFLDAGSKYKVGDLIKTVIVASANDSSIALAEHIAGSEEVFVERMNKFASDLKLEDTHFENVTGLPAENHYSSAYDLVEIYKVVSGNELYKKYAKIWMDDFVHPSGRKTGLVNTNRLVRTYDGIEGGKTGFTNSARFCLTASACRNSTRLIGVLIGVNDSKTRFAEMTKMFNYGFANYETKMIVNSEIPITIMSAQRSREKFEVYAKNDSIKFFPKEESGEFTTDFQLNNVKAPLCAGDVVGKLFVFDKNNMVVDEIDLVTKCDVSAEKFKHGLQRIIQAW